MSAPPGVSGWSRSAKALSVGRRQAVCQCLVYSCTGDQEALVAVAQGTITVVPPRTDGARTV
jgi:acyl-coenzyme A thioesterase PaaI-like protein